jgi:hypothetical protein
MRAALVRGFAPVLLLLLVLVPAPLAQAHDSLVSSTPQAGQVLATAPAEVSLTFSATIGQEFAQVAVVDSTGAAYQDGAPVVDGPLVTQALLPMPADAEITISYRVVSSDGHPIGGTVPFTVAPAGADPATAGGATDAQTDAATDAQPEGQADAPADGQADAQADAQADPADDASDAAPADQPAEQDRTAQTVSTDPDTSAGPGRWLAGAGLAAVATLVVLGLVLTRRRSRTRSEVA